MPTPSTASSGVIPYLTRSTNSSAMLARLFRMASSPTSGMKYVIKLATPRGDRKKRLPSARETETATTLQTRNAAEHPSPVAKIIDVEVGPFDEIPGENQSSSEIIDAG